MADRSKRDATRHARSTTTSSVWLRRPSSARIGGAVVVALLLYYVVSLLQVIQAGRDHDASAADAIVVLGAAQYDGRPSPQLAARLDHALLLWERGIAPAVMVTGGKQAGDRFTEAEASRQYLVERGVPDDAIMVENAGRTTFESMESAASLLLAAGRDTVVLVSDPSHMKRSELIAEGFGLDAEISATTTSVVSGWESVRNHVEEAGGVALGRIIGFDRLSDLAG